VIKLIATQDIKQGEAVAVSPESGLVRPSFQGERPAARAVEDIPKGQLAVVDMTTGLMRLAKKGR
jgi:predicted transcriptional regulator